MLEILYRYWGLINRANYFFWVLKNPVQPLAFTTASCLRRGKTHKGATERILVNGFLSYPFPNFLLSSWPTSELEPDVSKFSWVLGIVKTAFSCRQEGAAEALEHSPLIQAAICGYDLLQTDYSFSRNPTWETTQCAGNWKQSLAQASFKVQHWPLNL